MFLIFESDDFILIIHGILLGFFDTGTFYLVFVFILLKNDFCGVQQLKIACGFELLTQILRFLALTVLRIVRFLLKAIFLFFQAKIYMTYAFFHFLLDLTLKVRRIHQILTLLRQQVHDSFGLEDLIHALVQIFLQILPIVFYY